MVGVTIHGLRYTAATILEELGVDIEIRQMLLGHETISMAKKYSAQKRGVAKAVQAFDSGETVKPSRGSVKP